MKIRYIASIKIMLSSLNNIIFITQMPFNIHGALASTTAAMLTANILENATNAKSKNFSSSVITLASGNAQGAATAIEIEEIEKEQQQELHQRQSQPHNSTVNLHVQEDPKNQHQEYQQYSLTNPQQHHKDENGTSMIQISLVTSSGHTIQSSKAINANGDIKSLSISSQGDLVFLSWTGNDSIYFSPITI
jgi:hypothetical protein